MHIKGYLAVCKMCHAKIWCLTRFSVKINIWEQVVYEVYLDQISEV